MDFRGNKYLGLKISGIIQNYIDHFLVCGEISLGVWQIITNKVAGFCSWIAPDRLLLVFQWPADRLHTTRAPAPVWRGEVMDGCWIQSRFRLRASWNSTLTLPVLQHSKDIKTLLTKVIIKLFRKNKICILLYSEQPSAAVALIPLSLGVV